MLRKRRHKQGVAEQGLPLSRRGEDKTPPKVGTKLIFAEGTAAVTGRWEPGVDEGPQPKHPNLQP